MVPGGEPQFNNRPQKKFKKRSLLLTTPTESTWHTLRDHTGKSRQSSERESQDLAQNAFISAWVESLRAPGLRPDWFIQIKRVELWEAPQRSYLRCI